MQKENKQQWANQSFANRVSISTNPGKLKIVVKAENFPLGNNILTLALSSVIIGNVLLAYLVGVGMVTFGIVTSSIALISLVVSFGLARAWFWHNFGEENIEFNGNQLSVSRNYTIYKTKKNIIELDESTDLFTNKVDTWNWNKMQNKGVLRVSNSEISVDFGIKLNDEEYEMLVIPIGNKIKQYKTEKELSSAEASSDTTDDKPVVEPEKLDSKEQNIKEDAAKPNLEEQHEGEHRKVLDDYYKKIASSSEDLLNKIDSGASSEQAEKNKDEEV